VGSISLGSPIFYRDLEVGTVLGWDLGNMARSVAIHAFVRAPFDKYVHEDSTFWNASGLSLKMGANGIELQMESVKALLLGGIAFETKPGAAPAATADHRFVLYPNREAARASGFSHHVEFMSRFSGSVAGLEVGADVTLHGLKIGEVTDVALTFDPKIQRIVAPVRYRIDAERISGIAAVQGLPPGTLAAEMVRRGFRATLQAPSLISPARSWRWNTRPTRRPTSCAAKARSLSFRRPRAAASTASPAPPRNSCRRSIASTSPPSAPTWSTSPRASTTRSTGHRSNPSWPTPRIRCASSMPA
jgi:paraquat-inducible protein B